MNQLSLDLPVTPKHEWPGPPENPKFGQPCNGCGMCCLAEQCDISLSFYGPKPVCPALVAGGDKLVCGLISDPHTHWPSKYFNAESSEYFFPYPNEQAYWPMLKRVIGINTACYSDFADEMDQPNAASAAPPSP